MKAFLVLILALPLCGCMTKSKAKAEARAAYFAGQQRGFAQMQEAQRTNIRVIGPVQNPEITWTNGLTLAQVVAAANYTGRSDPKDIFIYRQRERLYFDPKALLNGKDLPLEPGDTVEIRP
jgi:hypothetical protein